MCYPSCNDIFPKDLCGQGKSSILLPPAPKGYTQNLAHHGYIKQNLAHHGYIKQNLAHHEYIKQKLAHYGCRYINYFNITHCGYAMFMFDNFSENLFCNIYYFNHIKVLVFLNMIESERQREIA